MNGLYVSAEEPAPLMEINTTPLIDILLVLLIVLILTMPPLTHRTAMDLGNAGKADVARPAVTIGIEYDGSLYWDGTPVANFEQLEEHLRSAAGQTEQPDIRIDASRAAKYDSVVKVLVTAQRSGLRRVGFTGQERFAE